jgi:hypothetical protein
MSKFILSEESTNTPHLNGKSAGESAKRGREQIMALDPAHGLASIDAAACPAPRRPSQLAGMRASVCNRVWMFADLVRVTASSVQRKVHSRGASLEYFLREVTRLLVGRGHGVDVHEVQKFTTLDLTRDAP